MKLRLLPYLLPVFATAIFSASAAAQVTFPEAAINYQAYPEASALPRLSPPPDGYQPFHIEHFGRHGSRWHLSARNYERPLETLRMAERHGALTERGRQVLTSLDSLNNNARGRYGELTPLGHEQHKGIARRMAINFPQVFAPEAIVNGRSTVVIRSILSMLEELEELRGCYTDLRINSDASVADMYYMNSPDRNRGAILIDSLKPALDRYRDSLPATGEFVRVLIDDERLIADSIDVNAFMSQMFDIAANEDSHPDRSGSIRDIFTPEEIDRQWSKNNAFWYWHNGNTPLTGYASSLQQVNMLKNIIASADTTLTSPRHSINLRFGHETNIIALAVMLGLDNADRVITSYGDVADKWHAQDIIPMAANIQLIFYRPTRPGPGGWSEDDILVKALLNEREVTMPGIPVTGPYYRWTTLRDQYLKKTAE